MFEVPDTTTVSVGVATKPYPSWRLPGKTMKGSMKYGGRLQNLSILKFDLLLFVQDGIGTRLDIFPIMVVNILARHLMVKLMV